MTAPPTPDEPVSTPSGPGAMNPAAMSLTDAARLLTRVGGERVTVAMLEADLNAGAPANPDGTLNLVHFVAWLVREAARGD
jgi:hypothetical protein